MFTSIGLDITVVYADPHQPNRFINTLDNVDVELVDNEVGINGETALHYAAQENNTQAIAVLHQAGADINAQDNYDRTALYQATYKNNVPAIAVLELMASEKIVRLGSPGLKDRGFRANTKTKTSDF